jgi:hypothetical protein
MHATVESDVYNCFYIPKGMRVAPELLKSMLIYSTGATITPNVWYG